MFLQSFLKTLLKPFIIIVLILGFYTFLMSFVNHQKYPFEYLVFALAAIKTAILAFVTVRQLTKLIAVCNSVNKLLWVFGSLIFLSIFSFATDYACLFMINNDSFTGVLFSSSYVNVLFNFFYFSVTTFSTLGFGDIAASSVLTRLVVLMEVFLSFIIVVFALSNISKIHIKK